LTRIGKLVGTIDSNRWERFNKKLREIEKLRDYLTSTRQDSMSLWDLLRRPDNEIADTLRTDAAVRTLGVSDEAIEAVIIDAKYEGYLTKQNRLAANLQTLEHKKIPQSVDFRTIPHLRAEAREKLSAFAPETLGQASRISGITPADITVIQVHLRKCGHDVSGQNSGEAGSDNG